jgi:PAS domain S-box-containing protein
MARGEPDPTDLGIGRIFPRAADALIIGDAQTGRIVLWNASAAQLFGYSADEAVGMSIERLVPENLVDAHRTGLTRFLQTGTGQIVDHRTAVELPVRHKDGSTRQVDLSLTSLEDVAQPHLVLAALRDVTARHSFEQEHRRLSELLELALDAVFVRDADRRITYWNRGAEVTYGWAREEALGQIPQDLLSTEYPLAIEEIERIVTEKGAWEGDLIQHAKDGRRLIVEARWAAQYDGAGHLVGLLEVNRDISARLEAQSERERLQAEAEEQRFQQRLRQSQRLESLGELAGGVAHDFNNLLAVIINYAEFVTDEIEHAVGRAADDPVWARLRNDAQHIVKASDRAARLTRQLLAFARREPIQPQVVNLNEVVAAVKELLERTLGEHVELITDLADNVRPITADPGQLEQVLVNMAVNSRDAMPGGGTLTVDTANVDMDDVEASAYPGLSPGSYVRVRVSDTGVGMPKLVADRAFDPFFTTKPRGEGTGLGLATVYGIVTQAGGSVRIYSEPGVGTSITVLLPAMPSEASISADRSEGHDDRPSGRLTGTETILVVENDDALREATRRILDSNGYRVLVAADGADAIAAATVHPGSIDLLLTDIIMPRMLGKELAERLRRLRPGVMVLYMSGFAQTVLRPLGHLEDDSTVIEKPVSAAELLSRVRRALDT